MMDKLEKVLMPLADILTKNRVLIAIRDGFLITTPLLIVGSIFLLFANFPIPGWEDFWTGILGGNLNINDRKRWYGLQLYQEHHLTVLVC